MSKFTVIELWEQLYPYQTEVNDYTGRKMLKSAIGNQNSRYCPTIDHIRPLSRRLPIWTYFAGLFSTNIFVTVNATPSSPDGG